MINQSTAVDFAAGPMSRVTQQMPAPDKPGPKPLPAMPQGDKPGPKGEPKPKP